MLEDGDGRFRSGAAGAWLRRDWLAPAFVFLLVFAVFLPCLRNGFVAWDDSTNYQNNPFYRGLSWSNIRWMFTTLHKGHYQPLTWLTLGLDYALWGMDPKGYHLTSLLLHAANAVLFYFVARRLMVSARRSEKPVPAALLRCAAALAALLFAVHPLRAESVAWVTARRDVVSGFFVLLSVLAYLRAREGEARREEQLQVMWRCASVAAFALSVLARENCVMLAPVLVVLDIHPLRRFGPRSQGWGMIKYRAVWMEKLPYFVIASAGAVAAVLATAHIGHIRPLEDRSVILWAVQAVYQLVFHIHKTLLPLDLAPLYPIPVPFKPWTWGFLLSGALVSGLAYLLWALRHRWPSAMAAGAAYALFLAPTLGFADTISLAYDRFSYLSCMGWALLAGGGWLMVLERNADGVDGRRRSAMAAACLALLVLSALTVRQIGIWRNTESLWRHALAVDPDNHVAHHNLAVALHERQDLKTAIMHDREAVRLDPNYVAAHVVLCALLSEQGAQQEAIRHCMTAIRLNPRFSDAYLNLGVVQLGLRQIDLAADSFREAVRLQPDSVLAICNLGYVLLAQGRWDEASAKFIQGLMIDRNYPALIQGLNMAQARVKPRFK